MGELPLENGFNSGPSWPGTARGFSFLGAFRVALADGFSSLFTRGGHYGSPVWCRQPLRFAP